ncbi:MAG: cation:proton antiporter, partial [Candidatus Omnitrophica bacterium]|nr:cation:proton antiporter [Candidatus Omnitrophota bacterium]
IFNTVATAAFIVVFLFFVSSALRELPSFGNPTMAVVKKYLEEGVSKTGSVNLVTAVVLDFRAYDTLGEVAVLFTAVIGILTVLRRRGRKKIGEKDDD